MKEAIIIYDCIKGSTRAGVIGDVMRRLFVGSSASITGIIPSSLSFSLQLAIFIIGTPLLHIQHILIPPLYKCGMFLGLIFVCHFIAIFGVHHNDPVYPADPSQPFSC